MHDIVCFYNFLTNFAKFGVAMIKSTAGAASRKTESMGPRSREALGRRLGEWTTATRGASLDLGPLDLVFLEAALAADLITASISRHVATAPNPFLDPTV